MGVYICFSGRFYLVNISNNSNVNEEKINYKDYNLGFFYIKSRVENYLEISMDMSWICYRNMLVFLELCFGTILIWLSLWVILLSIYFNLVVFIVEGVGKCGDNVNDCL